MVLNATIDTFLENMLYSNRDVAHAEKVEIKFHEYTYDYTGIHVLI